MSNVKKYKKNPLEIEALQFTWESWNEMWDFMEGGSQGKPPNGVIENGVKLELKIPTLEGVMTASQGDYIIKGIDGEFYPCKEDIFLRTYSEV